MRRQSLISVGRVWFRRIRSWCTESPVPHDRFVVHATSTSLDEKRQRVEGEYEYRPIKRVPCRGREPIEGKASKWVEDHLRRRRLLLPSPKSRSSCGSSPRSTTVLPFPRYPHCRFRSRTCRLCPPSSFCPKRPSPLSFLLSLFFLLRIFRSFHFILEWINRPERRRGSAGKGWFRLRLRWMV